MKLVFILLLSMVSSCKKLVVVEEKIVTKEQPLLVPPVLEIDVKSAQQVNKDNDKNLLIDNLIERSQLELNSGKTIVAEKLLEQALNLEPNNSRTWFQLSKVRRHQQKNQESISLAEKALGLASDPILIKSIAMFIKESYKKLIEDNLQEVDKKKMGDLADKGE